MTTETPPKPKRKMPARSAASKTEVIGLRLSPTDSEAIRRLAAERDMTLTQYVIDSALDRLDPDFIGGDEQRLDAIERRIERLETLAYGIEPA